MALTPEQEVFAVGLIDGAQSVFENADRLFYEAGVLADVEAFPRAYLLHQISLEECGKNRNVRCRSRLLSNWNGGECNIPFQGV